MSGEKKPAQRPQLIALDIDGTIVESRKPVRPKVVEAIKRVRAAGIHVTLVTGRMYVAAKPFAELLELDGPICCYQGAVIADAATGRFEREVALPHDVAIRAYEAAKAEDFHIQLYRDDRFYVESYNEFAKLYAETAGTQPVVVDSLADAFRDHDSTKAVIVTTTERVPRALALVTEVCGKDAYITRSNPEFVEMLNPKVDKGVALREVCAHYGIEPERVLAVGDSYNDLPFLKVAGFSVAMGSGPEELKSEADAVVADVHHDGVAEALDRFVLL